MPHGPLWTSTGTLLATGTFTGESPSGWQTLTFATPVPGHRGDDVRGVVLRARRVTTPRTPGFFAQAYDNAPLHAPASVAGAGNGLFSYGGDVFPASSFGASNYWVDPIFTASAPAAAPSEARCRPHAARAPLAGSH